MVIGDIFGSWVQGAHEGQSDAIAMRQAQDQTAQSAYALQRQGQFDPLQYRMLHNAANTSDLEYKANQDIFGIGIPQRMAQAGAEGAEIKNTQVSAAMGDPFPYLHHQQQSQGASLTPNALAYPFNDSQGKQQYYPVPYEDMGSLARQRALWMQQYQQARVEAQTRGQDLHYDEWAMKNGLPTSNGATGGTPNYKEHSIFGGGIPSNQPPIIKATNPQSSVQPEQNPYGVMTDPYAVAKKVNTVDNVKRAA